MKAAAILSKNTEMGWGKQLSIFFGVNKRFSAAREDQDQGQIAEESEP